MSDTPILTGEIILAQVDPASMSDTPILTGETMLSQVKANEYTGVLVRPAMD